MDDGILARSPVRHSLIPAFPHSLIHLSRFASMIARMVRSAASMPSVMTPSEAATFLRVSEEDVVAAIQAGDLKAKKIGNAYRISKEAVEEFLKG